MASMSSGSSFASGFFGWPGDGVAGFLPDCCGDGCALCDLSAHALTPQTPGRAAARSRVRPRGWRERDFINTGSLHAHYPVLSYHLRNFAIGQKTSFYAVGAVPVE